RDEIPLHAARVPGGLACPEAADERDHSPPAPNASNLPHDRSRLLPGAGRHQVVDDVWRDQDQEIAPLLRLRREAEQLPEERQVYKEGDSRLGYRDRGHREAADHRRLAVADEYLVVGLPPLD